MSDAMPESVDHRLPMWKVGSSIPCGVKPKAYTIDTCHYLTCYLAFQGDGKHWLAQYQDNVTGNEVMALVGL